MDEGRGHGRQRGGHGMKLASLNNGDPDGRLLIVSRDLSRAEEAQTAATLQAALEEWEGLEGALTRQYEMLSGDSSAGFAFDARRCLAVLPRSYQFLDASAFLAHNHILADAWGFARRAPVDP